MKTIEALEKLKQNAERLASREGIVDALVETFKEIAPQVEDKNIEQLKRGERADDVVLPNYSPVSVAKFGKPAGPIKLFDSGDFYAGVVLRVSRSGMELTDSDYKTDLLEERYGEEILGLQERSVDELKEDAVLPSLRASVLKRLTA